MIVPVTPIMVLICVRASSYVSFTGFTYFFRNTMPPQTTPDFLLWYIVKCLLKSNKHYTSRVPVEGKSSVCLICMKCRIIFVIIIISLGQILLSYIANTSRKRARTHERTYAHACARTRANACTRRPPPPPRHTHRRRRIAIR